LTATADLSAVFCLVLRSVHDSIIVKGSQMTYGGLAPMWF